jgi:hypothetical protein
MGQSTRPRAISAGISTNESEEIHRKALERARREHPEARRAVARMYEEQRWHFWWAREAGFPTHDMARATAAVDRAVKAA